LQPPIQLIEPFDTNEFKGDKMTRLDPNHIRIFYMNINGLKLGQGGHLLLQLCLTLKEKGVHIVCLTETNVHWARAHVYHKFRKTLGLNKNSAFAHPNQTSNGIPTVNQEEQQCSH